MKNCQSLFSKFPAIPKISRRLNKNSSPISKHSARSVSIILWASHQSILAAVTAIVSSEVFACQHVSARNIASLSDRGASAKETSPAKLKGVSASQIQFNVSLASALAVFPVRTKAKETIVEMNKF